jgi:SAM-dependent methyltransferase
MTLTERFRSILRPRDASEPRFDLVKYAKDTGATTKQRFDIGLRDAVGSGHYNNATGELYPGIPITAEDVVLDVGCGDGAKTGFCARTGAAVIYVDSDPHMIEVASRRLADSGARSLTPIVSDANPLPIPDATATRIVASEVMEHVDDVPAFLAELIRVGKPGALYLLTVPDAAVEGLQKKLAPASYFEKPNHIRVFGRDAFVQAVTDAGLIVEARGTHGFYWALWLLLYRSCGDGDEAPLGNHSVLENWANTWSALLDNPGGMRVKQALDEFMPVSQYIVARKPGP